MFDWAVGCSTAAVEYPDKCLTSDVERWTARRTMSILFYFFAKYKFINVGKSLELQKNSCDYVNAFCIGLNYAFLYILCVHT